MSTYKVHRKDYPDVTVEADSFNQDEIAVSFYEGEGYRLVDEQPHLRASCTGSNVTLH